MFTAETVPPVARDRQQWVNWGNMPTEKRPTQPVPDTVAASATDPTTWGTYTDALMAATLHDDRGVGLVLTEHDPLLAFDIDCPRYADGSLPDWLPPLSELASETWCYRTPSGAGWRVVVTVAGAVAIPDWWKDLSDTRDGQTREIALSYAGKYMTVTGNLLSDDHREPSAVPSGALDKWLQEAHRRFTGNQPPTERTTTCNSAGGTHDPAMPTVYDILDSAAYPPGARVSHPFHGSDTDGNFVVDYDTDGETWRCWRHDVTGHAGHLLGMETGVLTCQDAHRKVSGKEWAEIYETARWQGYDLPER